MQRDPFEETLAPPRKWGSWTNAERSAPPAEQPDYLGSIPAADWKPKKRKDTRKRPPVFFVRNIYDLKEPLREIAHTIGIPRDMLVRYFLERGLEAHQSGERPLIPVLDQRLTLYPGEKPPGKRRKRNPNARGVGIRNLPGDLVAQIQGVAQSLSVPVWQVVRMFLEQGIADYHSGTLELPVVSVQIHRPTLYPDDS